MIGSTVERTGGRTALALPGSGWPAFLGSPGSAGAAMTGSGPLLELRGIDKRFGGVHANRSVDLTLHAGEVLGLLGENGAGKTTLMNILFGIYRADAGQVRIDGHPVAIRSPADALAAGIGMVHQHFHLVERHSVLENLMVGESGRRGLLDRAGARARLAGIGERYGLRLDADRPVGLLSVGEQQRLEIIKALYRGARVLILDEPTSVLTPQETEGLFRAIRTMAAQGVGVIFISHKLNEVRAITDRLVVMRQGAVVATAANDGSLGARRLAELMCGHELRAPVREATRPGPVLLALDRVSTRPGPEHPVALKEVSLSVRGGEILGLVGVSGNGQRELAEVIGGTLAATGGRIEVAGRPARGAGARRRRRLGVAHVPEDRLGAGLLRTAPLVDSMILARVGEAPFSRRGILNHDAAKRFVADQIAKFGIRAAGPEARTGTLSGGNLQKALLARELAFEPLVLIAAQPTRGLDVAAKEFVHGQLLGLRARGRAVLVISEDLEELFEIADRIAVIFEGRILDSMPVGEAEVARIGLLMAGAEATP
jgi:general nucleoside transport system ATP-binding protein